MARDPFVWEVQVRSEVLEDEVAKLRELPYSLWREMLSREMTKSATGRDNRPYRVASPRSGRVKGLKTSALPPSSRALASAAA